MAMMVFVVVGVTTTIVMAGGDDILRGYFEEYAGGGSCKWRGPDGHRFWWLLVGGLAAWPAGACALGMSAMDVCANRKQPRQAIALFVLVTMTVVAALARLVRMGAARGVLEQC